MNVLIVGIVILTFVVITIINKKRYEELNKGIQNQNCMPQPIILANGQMLMAQINITYNIIDKNKAKKVLKSGLNIFRQLEYEGITNLRRIVGSVESGENLIGKLEVDLKSRLSEIGQDLGVEVIELHIKFVDKNEVN